MLDQGPNPGNRLCGLRHHAETGTRIECINFFLALDYIAFWQILGESAHLHMPVTANDDRVIPGCPKDANLLVGLKYELARRIPQRQTIIPHPCVRSV